MLTSSKLGADSWFQQVREICIRYQLPHPISLLQHPPTTSSYKRLVRSRIIDHWEVKLRSDALRLSSTPYFKPNFMSLMKPHPMWSACGSNPFQCHKAVIAARMLSGRYLTDQLQRHWTSNKEGYCLLPSCTPSQSIGSLEHLLLYCTSLHDTRVKLVDLCNRLSEEDETLANIIQTTITDTNLSNFTQILLDCTSVPSVILATQIQGNTYIRDRLLFLGRTWCHSIHRERMKQLGLLKFR